MKASGKAKLKNDGKWLLERAKVLAKFAKMKVKVGFFGSKGGEGHEGTPLTNTNLASIHEYGTSTVPARPFLHPSIDAQKKPIANLFKKAIEVQTKTKKPAMNPEKYTKDLGKIGMFAATAVRKFVTQNMVKPDISDETKKRKKSTRPLVDTGQMIRAVDSIVIKGGK